MMKNHSRTWVLATLVCLAGFAACGAEEDPKAGQSIDEPAASEPVASSSETGKGVHARDCGGYANSGQYSECRACCGEEFLAGRISGSAYDSCLSGCKKTCGVNKVASASQAPKAAKGGNTWAERVNDNETACVRYL